MTAGGDRRGAVLAIGPLPPPLHGYSLITSLVIEQLRRVAPVEAVDISPGALVRGWRYHAARLRRVARALWVLACRPSHGGALYLAIAGGAGVVYDVLLATAARWRGYRVFIHHNAFTYINRRSRWTALVIAVTGTATTHICLCPTMARRLREQYPRVRLTAILSNAALIAPPAAARPGSATPEVSIGFLSNLIPEKGLDVVIEVLRSLRERGAAARLVVAGPALDAATRQVLDEARRAFGPAFDYRGPVYDAEKSAFFRDIDVFLFPSRYANEAQPLVVLEALAHGVPVMATARGCIPDDLTQGGMVVAPDTAFVAASVAAVTGWLADPAALADLQATAHAHAGELHRAAQGNLGRLIDLMTAVPG
jgi:glycosyltransferase involved in cell wall biosynthesis